MNQYRIRSESVPNQNWIRSELVPNQKRISTESLHLWSTTSSRIQLSFLCKLAPVACVYPEVNDGSSCWNRQRTHPRLDRWQWHNGMLPDLEETCWNSVLHGPLNTAGDGVKCNYLIYWAGKMGMDLVDKWETEGKLTDANWNTIDRYFELFEEHISPKSNALIAIVELKRLFQGTLSLEDFHTKALWLVKEAKYPEGDIRNRVLQDTIISSLASDKIRAKVIKEGEDITLARVMEIAWLEVSTQRHLDHMQETAKVNYVKYGRGSKAKGRSKPKPSGSNGSSSGSWPKTGDTSKTSKPAMKGGKPKLPNNICWRCGKPWHQKLKYCKALEAVCRGCNTKGHYKKVCMKKSAHQVGVHDNSNPEYYDKLGDPVYVQTHMVSINQVGKEETPYPVPNQRWPTESEETGKNALSYRSTEGWHRSRCKSS